ncbi:enoyl-CoA hydratase/isomerase family protein [Pontibacillus salicampi]|uniref:3-hydroxyisobutyryl-CoA hydrolase n=1 Tax=Pontibacillus salicampi TaxID=1449801 RepID=A0ABV6LSR9_9BACI
MNEVLCEVQSTGLATITLNRPKAINSLTYGMLKEIHQKLKEWETDENVQLVLLQGAGEKGFCAGGDIKSLYEARSSHQAYQHAVAFFEEEYEVDHYIYSYPKPIVACLDGVVMGGGVGLSYGARYRIVTDRTKWAMPEMNIGFFPDVGAAHFLNKAPGYIGRYLALTAEVIPGADTMYIHAADTFIPSDKVTNFIGELERTNWGEVHVDNELLHLIQQYSQEPSPRATLPTYQKEIDECFSHQRVEDIMDALEKQGTEFARKTREQLLSKSPASLKVTLKQLMEGEGASREECFRTDLILAKQFMHHEDFYEGVRSVLVDKDRTPNYIYQSLADVSDELVASFFKPPHS